MERSSVSVTPTARQANSTGPAEGDSRGQKHRFCGVKSMCDKASDHAPVMLHLRPRYDSKAAILTIPATIFAGRKSKSRLNSKGLDR
jgi:hypothetical protein